MLTDSETWPPDGPGEEPPQTCEECGKALPYLCITPLCDACLDSPAPIPPSALRTPPLHPRTLAWLQELRDNLAEERATQARLFMLEDRELQVAERRCLAARLRVEAARRAFYRSESLSLNLTPARPLEPPPW